MTEKQLAQSKSDNAVQPPSGGMFGNLNDLHPKKASKASGYTVRMDAEDGADVEAAAKVLNMTTAKFMREAVVAKSRDVLNSQDRNAVAMRRIAGLLSEYLIDPSIRVIGDLDGERVESTLHFEYDRAVRRDEPSTNFKQIVFWDFYQSDEGNAVGERVEVDAGDCANKTDIRDVRMCRMSDSDLDDVVRMLHDSGSEFVRILLEELTARKTGKPSYRPVKGARIETDGSSVG